MSNFDWDHTTVDRDRSAAEHTEAIKLKKSSLYFLLGSAAALFIVLIFIVFTQLMSTGKNIADTVPASPSPAPSSIDPTTSAHSNDDTQNEQTSAPDQARDELITPARPAPDGAVELTSFTTPSKNIMCEIDESSAACTIKTYSFTAPPQCAEQPVTLRVGTGEAQVDCSSAVSSSHVMDYGTAVEQGDFACTVAESGVECWNKILGTGFEVRRTAARVF